VALSAGIYLVVSLPHTLQSERYLKYNTVIFPEIIMYSQEVIDHFAHPRNQGHMEDPDGVGQVGNPVCGDVMYIYIKVKDDIIEDIKWETMGCAAAIAVSSMMSEIAKGKTIGEAEKITRDDVAGALDGLPPIKMHCSNLAADGLKKAIEDYKKKRGLA
jgi:nitrogen fixation NifU-like protein